VRLGAGDVLEELLAIKELETIDNVIEFEPHRRIQDFDLNDVSSRIEIDVPDIVDLNRTGDRVARPKSYDQSVDFSIVGETH
jgi:hypothetical protein